MIGTAVVLNLAVIVVIVVLTVRDWWRRRRVNQRRFGGAGKPYSIGTLGVVCWYRGYHRPGRFLPTYQPHVQQRACSVCGARWYRTTKVLP